MAINRIAHQKSLMFYGTYNKLTLLHNNRNT